MELTSKKISTLADDIRQIIAKARGEKQEMIRLCRDHRDPYLHFDKKAVLNIAQDEFVGIFDLNANHYFLSPEQAFRLGTYCQLALPNLIAFMLKAEWEGFLSEMSGYSLATEINLKSIINDRDIIEKYISDFKPGKGGYFNLIKDVSYIPIAYKTFGHIDFYIHDLINNNSFLIENDKVVNLYPDKDITEKALLRKITKQQREKYMQLKELWKIKSSELDDLLLYLERKKKVNLNIENKYFRTFGKIEIEKSKFTYRVERYKIILEIMKESPELSYRELIKLSSRKMADFDREKDELNNNMARSLNCIEDYIPYSNSASYTSEFKNSYLQACKTLLRKLFFLLHSDTCPNYAELSKQKKSEVNKLWLKLMKSTKNEFYSFSPTMLLYSLPDYDHLLSIYKIACDILEINEDDFELGNRLEFMISNGAPIDTIFEFLTSETERTEIHLAHLELIKDEYTNEEQCQIYRTAQEDIKGHNEKLRSDISELNNQIIDLKKKISLELLKVA